MTVANMLSSTIPIHLRASQSLEHAPHLFIARLTKQPSQDQTIAAFAMAIQYVHNFFRRDPNRSSKDKKLDRFVEESQGQYQANFLDEEKQFLRITRAFVESNSVEDTIEDVFKAMRKRGLKKYWQRRLTVTGCYPDRVEVDIADLGK